MSTEREIAVGMTEEDALELLERIGKLEKQKISPRIQINLAMAKSLQVFLDAHDFYADSDGRVKPWGMAEADLGPDLEEIRQRYYSDSGQYCPIRILFEEIYSLLARENEELARRQEAVA